jgi:hypothetical protein
MLRILPTSEAANSGGLVLIRGGYRSGSTEDGGTLVVKFADFQLASTAGSCGGVAISTTTLPGAVQ